MSLLVDLQLVPQRILDRVRAAVLQNREALRHGGTRSRVVQATKQRPQFTKVGATMRDYVAPVPIATGRPDEPPNLGWIYRTGNDAEDYVLVSGNGSESLTVSAPENYKSEAWPLTVNADMRPFDAQYIDTQWSVWQGGGTSGNGMALWFQSKRLSSVRFPCRFKVKSNVSAEVTTPAKGGSIYIDYRTSMTTFNYYVVAADNTRQDIPQTGDPTGEKVGELNLRRYVHAPAGADPASYIVNPQAQKWIEVRINGRPYFDDHQYAQSSTYAMRVFSVKRDTVTGIDTPLECEQKVQGLLGFPAEAQVVEGERNLGLRSSSYPEDANGNVILLPPTTGDEWKADYLGVYIENGISYPVYTGGLFNFEGFNSAPYYIYFLTVPSLLPVSASTDVPPSQTKIVLQDAGSFGVIRKASGDAQGGFSRYIATPAVYGLLDGTATVTESDLFQLTIPDLISRFEFWPPKFQFLAVSDASAGTALDYASDDQQVVTTYANNPDNFSDPAYYYNFGGGPMDIPGSPSRYRFNMVPVQDRVELPGTPEIILTTTYGANAYCNERLIELGFDLNDL